MCIRDRTYSSVVQFNLKNERRNRHVKTGNKFFNIHATIEKDEQRRVERKAKERLQALKANDEEAYIKLLDQTKDTRITHLLKQTNAFLDSLTRAVKDQQKYTKEMIDSHLLEASEEDKSVSPSMPVATFPDEEDGEEKGNFDYYSVAHRIKAVSYTHLDVYKRQGLIHPRKQLRIQRIKNLN